MGSRRSDEENDAPKEAPKAAPAPSVAPAVNNAVKPEDLKTEQEKGAPDPVSPPQESPGPVETIESQGIGSRQPYPSKDG